MRRKVHLLKNICVYIDLQLLKIQNSVAAFIFI